MNPQQEEPSGAPDVTPLEEQTPSPLQDNQPQGLPDHVQNAIDNWGQPSATHFEINQQQVFTQNMMPSAKKRTKLPLFLAVFALLLLIIGGGVAMVVNSQKVDYSQVFSTAINNSLSVKSYEMKGKVDNTKFDDNDLNTKADLSDFKNPKAYQTINNLPSKGYTFEAYSEPDKALIKLTKQGDSKTEELPSSVVNKWILIDNTPEYSSSDFVLQSEVASAIIGEFIVGNFNDVDKLQLTDFISKNQVYKFNEGAVQVQKIGRRKTYVYSVNVNFEKLIELNKTAAKMLGTKTEQVDALVSQNIPEEPKNMKIFIDANSKQVVKVSYEIIGANEVYEYEGFGVTQVPAPPSQQLSKKDFFKYIEYDDLGDGGLEIPDSQSVKNKERDTERKSDMRSIQSKLAEFYAVNSRYPTSLDDVALNLDEDSCQAPNGSGTCQKPDYTYKAFTASTDISGLATFSASSKVVANATATDAEFYILYTNSMEAQSNNSSFFQVSSSF